MSICTSCLLNNFRETINSQLMNCVRLFTDGSVHAQSGVGYGAYLFVSENDSLLKPLKPVVKRFEETSSTRLELQTLLWALDTIGPSNGKIYIYTDSQNIISLPERRDRLEQHDFKSKRNKLLSNHELYRQFYTKVDVLDLELIKVVGHLSSGKKSETDRLFTLVDRAARAALRNDFSIN